MRIIAPLAAQSAWADDAGSSGTPTSAPRWRSNPAAYTDAVSPDATENARPASGSGAAPSFEVLAVAELERRLTDSEWCEAPLTDRSSPLTVVALPEPRTLVIPPSTPRVFVAITPNNAKCSDVDVVLTDTGADLDALARACGRNPAAVTTLVQLLRSTERAALEDALIAESLAYSMLLAGPEFAEWRRARPPTSRHPSSEPIAVEFEEDACTIALNRPEVHNAFSAAMRDALVDVLRPMVASPAPSRVNLVGRGPSFCSGGDLTEFGRSNDPAAAHAIRVARGPGLLLHQLGRRAVALLHGACIGAGVELPAFCARVEAMPDTTFSLPEVAMGLVPGAGGTVSIPRRIGRQRTALLAITGTTIDARTACAWGLIDCVVAHR